jgi:hypothetical protein
MMHNLLPLDSKSDHFIPLLIGIMVLDSQVQQVNLGLERLLTMVFQLKQFRRQFWRRVSRDKRFDKASVVSQMHPTGTD